MFGQQKKPQAQLKQLQSEDIEGFYYIIDINNLDSILKKGIYSHNAVRESGLYSKSNDISNASVQNCRERTFESPSSHKNRNLHDYVNFYLQPRNAMLFAIQKETPVSDICILKIKKELLAERADAILTNKNAACYRAGNEAKFFKENQWAMSPMSSAALSNRAVTENNIKNPFSATANDYKQKRQAEALFLNHVAATYISEIITGNDIAFQRVSGSVEDARSENIRVKKLPAVFRSSDDALRDVCLKFLDFSRNTENKENSIPNNAIKQTWLQTSVSSSPSPKTVTFFTTSFTPLPFLYDIPENDDDINSPQAKQQRTQ